MNETCSDQLVCRVGQSGSQLVRKIQIQETSDPVWVTGRSNEVGVLIVRLLRLETPAFLMNNNNSFILFSAFVRLY